MCFPKLEKDHAHCYTVCFHLCDQIRWFYLFLLFVSSNDMKEERIVFFFPFLWSNHKFRWFQLLRTWRDHWGRHSFIYFLHSFIFLPLVSLPDWLLSWLTAWMVGSLSHWPLTGTSLTHCVCFAEAGVEWDSRAAQALGSGISARFLSLSVLVDYWMRAGGNICLSLLQHWSLTNTTVLHPWLYIPGWCTGLDLSWFGNSALHRVSGMFLFFYIEMYE